MKNKKLILGFSVGVVVLVVAYLFMRNNCAQSITYIPESEISGALGLTKIGEHYEFMDFKIIKKFKTRNEAISYCMGNKINSED